MARPHGSDGRHLDGHRPLGRDADDPHDPVDPDWFGPPRSSWSSGLLAPLIDPLVERIPPRVLQIAVGALVAAGALFFVVPLFRPGQAPVEQRLPLAGESMGSTSGGGGAPSRTTAEGESPGSTSGAGGQSSTSTSVVESLTVQASGAVVRGGVYDLPAGARVDDLVRAAGGLAPDADVDRTNLAAPLADGERVWIPRRGDLGVPEVLAGAAGGGGGSGAAPAGGSGDAGGGTSATPSGPIDLNTATAEQLDTLPGVGPATAAAILAYREEHGRFSSVDELLEVRGIGDAKLEALREAVKV